MSLSLRRLNQSLKYSKKIESMPDHPTNEIMKKSWLTERTSKRRTTFLQTVQPYLEGIPHAENKTTDDNPPWQQLKPRVNMKLKKTDKQERNKRYGNTDDNNATHGRSRR